MFKEVDLKDAYKMISGTAVVASKGKISYDITPYGWIMPMDYEPVTKVIFSSDPAHQCAHNVKETKEFAVCIPKSQDAHWIEKAGSVSDEHADKFKMFGIEGTKAKKTDLMIPENEIQGWIECRLIRVIKEGSVELFMGEAVAAYSL